jgi:hypothetical protein
MAKPASKATQTILNLRHLKRIAVFGQTQINPSADARG